MSAELVYVQKAFSAQRLAQLDNLETVTTTLGYEIEMLKMGADNYVKFQDLTAIEHRL